MELLILGYFLIIALIFFVVLLAIKSNLLRDQISDANSFLQAARRKKKFGAPRIRKKNDIPRPFSLSRTQFALWTVVICSSYLYVYFCSSNAGAHIIIDSTSLTLLGISGGTTAAGMVIDTTQQDKYRHQNVPSQDFLVDILSDANGVSIARFQQFAWTIISIAVYLSQLNSLVPNHLPVLDNALLALTGLSSGAYLTMKAGENTGNSAGIALTNSMIASDSNPPDGIDPGLNNTFVRGEQKQPS